MSNLRQLAQQTALYGLSSILGRVLNFLLVPLHTMALAKGEYGVNTDLYTLIAFAIVVLTYGMETAFFHFSEHRKDQGAEVLSTALFGLVGSTLLFALLFEVFLTPLSSALRYTAQPHYLRMTAWILILDVLSAIPFAKLRRESRAIRFVSIKMALIGANILLNLDLFLWGYSARWFPLLQTLDGPTKILLANLVASSLMLLLLLPEYRLPKGARFRWTLWTSMAGYGFPLMLAGLAGIANELVDRQFLKYLLPADTAFEQLGVYGAVYKLSIFLVLFVQAFRYAAEPFFFKIARDTGDRSILARSMNLYALLLGGVFVGLCAGMPILKHFIDAKFWEGLDIVWILFLANWLLGLHALASMWYKLSGQTHFGLYVTLAGLVVTLTVNLALIPHYGIRAAAWATLLSYTTMLVLNLLLGQRHYPVPYDWAKLGLILGLCTLLGYLGWVVQQRFGVLALGVLLPYAVLAYRSERDALRSILSRWKT